MWLKHRNDVKWNDLPYIESAYFAQFEVEQALGNGRRIIGLERLLWEDVQFSRPLSSQEHEERKQRAWARLQERIKSHEVVLIVNQFRAPLAPLFRWKAEAGQPLGGRWEIQAPSHTSGHGGVERLLSEVQAPAPTSTGGGGDGLKAAVADRAKASDAVRNQPLAATAAAATALPTTHVEKRYTLLVALAYKAHCLFLNRVAAMQCKLENEFTGPESRRSGPIKTSDPAYYDVRRRELPEGEYTLALTRPPLAARTLKALRTKP